MYIANYRISDWFVNYLAELEAAKGVISVQISTGTTKSRLEKRLKSYNTFHLAHMLGVNMTLADAEKLIDGRKLPFEDVRGTLLNNFRNVMEFNRSNIVESYSNVDINLVTHLNKLVLTDWKEAWEAKLRTGGEPADNSLDNWVDMRDQTIDSVTLHQELLELLEWYSTNHDRIHPIIRIAVLLFRFWELSPYAAGNKLTALALTDFLLSKYGYSSKAFVPIMRSFDIYEAEYVEAYRSARQTKELSPWIERFTKFMAKDAGDVRDDVGKILGEHEASQKQPFLDLNKRQLKILKYLQTIPTVKREDYCQMMDVSTMTAYRDLMDLVDKKLLRLEGQGRGTKYVLYSR